MTVAESIIIGVNSGLLVFVTLVCVRNWFRNDVIRRLKSHEYVLGWTDACKELKEQTDRIANKTITNERK